jgi:hypothetical protein
MFILTDSQKVKLSIAPVSAAGNPAQVESVAWAVSDSDILTLEVAEDGLSCVVLTTGSIGGAQVSVSADADLGDGVEELVGTLEISVVGGAAVALGITAGQPEDK